MKRNILSLTLVILWMSLIFYLSHQPAVKSNGLSKGITEKIIEVVEKGTPNVDVNIRSFNHILRKNAHFFAYLVLGIVVANALKSCGVSGYRAIGFTLLVCVLYAISDEIHQLFIPGRSGEVKDVIIDSAGSLAGIALYYRSRIFKLIKP